MREGGIVSRLLLGLLIALAVWGSTIRPEVIETAMRVVLGM